VSVRLSSVERIALRYLALDPKPWDGKRADSIPAPHSILTRLLDRGLVRSQMNESLPRGIEDDTLLWITPDGRAALARTAAGERT
jgi:hypothetical protein